MRLPPFAVRIVILGVIVLAWWWLSRAPWYASARQWVNSRPVWSDVWLATISATLLGIFFLVLGWAHFYGPRSADSAMARGCAGVIAIGVAALGVVLAIGWFFHVSVIIKVVAVITILPAAQMLVGLIVEGVKAIRKK